MTYSQKPRILVVDIETLPAEAVSTVSEDPPARLSPSNDYAKTALSGDFGRILCIGYVDEDRSGEVRRGVLGWDRERERFSCDERQLLTEFWRLLHGFRPTFDRIVGHNLFDFDLKFIYKRSIVHGVPPTVELSFARYRNQPLFDTMYEWERWGYGSKISLDRLARALNLASSKDAGVDGSRVWELFVAGEHRAIHDYCLRDVELTRAIYRRMVFADERSAVSIQSAA